MILLVSGATKTVRAYASIGVLVVPGAHNHPRALPLHRPWAMDNGAFSGLNVYAFLRMMRRFGSYHTSQTSHGYQRCLFVTAPDVVANAARTLALFEAWEPFIHKKQLPVAFVGQDGLRLQDVPWDSLEAIFIGGSTAWKLGPVARTLVAYAKARGKWAHMGRVNTQRRIRYAREIGCDSIDGTSHSRWPQQFIPTFLRLMAQGETRWA